jgi:Fe-S-cluster-containing dehydrogenase component
MGCKDEHCNQSWLPYAEAQPDTGQFWMHVKQYERGQKPHVKVSYIPTPCQRCENAPCMAAAEDEAMYLREDGMPIIDPARARGQKAIADACPYGVVFWNEELEIPQKCTGCAHLIDGQDEFINVPRCFDNCPTGAIEYGEESELDLEGAELLNPEFGTQPHLWYKALPKRFVAGIVYDPVEKEIVEGASCTLVGTSGTFTATTDDMGDFWLRGLPRDDFTLTIEAGGKRKTLPVSTREKDIGLGDIALT